MIPSRESKVINILRDIKIHAKEQGYSLLEYGALRTWLRLADQQFGGNPIVKKLINDIFTILKEHEMLTDAFEQAYQFMKKWEGGLVDHPADPGGITNYGISIVFLKSFAAKYTDFVRGLGIELPITPDSIRKLTPEQSKLIYRVAFWDEQKLDDMPRLAAIAHFDLSMNAGSRQATLITQRVVGTTVDGLIGPKTRQATKDACKTYGELQIANQMLEQREQFYRNLAASKPSSKVFLKGWLNRTNDLKRYLNNL